MNGKVKVKVVQPRESVRVDDPKAVVVAFHPATVNAAPGVLVLAVDCRGRLVGSDVRVVPAVASEDIPANRDVHTVRYSPGGLQFEWKA